VTGGRDPDFEREFLRGAEKLAGLDIGWATAVADRLARMEREKGTSSYLELGLRRLLHETDEEALDLGGWPVLTAVALYAEADLGDERRQQAHLLLQAIGAHGVRVAGLVAELRELLAP
jgi:hypothetical protein